jgi:hypothetical protein
MKDKHLTIRITHELYEAYVKKTLAMSQKEKRLIKISEVIREILEKNKK